MTTIEVDAKGNLKIDGAPKTVEDLTQDFLEKLVDDSLESGVNYQIEGDMPLAGFFKAIHEGTKEGSELRKAKEKRDEKLAKAAEERKEIAKKYGDVSANDDAELSE